MTARERVAALVKALPNVYPDAHCELDFRIPLELLIATILSAQCTDKRVNMVTPGLFKKYRTAKDYANAPAGELETAIKSTGFFNSKAKSIRGATATIAEKFGGKVPSSMEQLRELPGVGRKTANVVLNVAFGEPTLAVDTHIFRVSNRTGLNHIWRMDVDGTRPRELTHGAGDSEPDISADGQWVVYKANVSGQGNIFRVAMDGGDPVLVTNGISGLPVVSPDGKQIALIYRTASAAPNKFAIMPFAGGEPQLIHDLPAHYGRFRWMPDGSGIAYADKQSGAGNIWIQPLDGSQPRQLTYWAANPIFSFAWSRNGNRLAFAGGTQTSDVVLINDLQQ